MPDHHIPVFVNGARVLVTAGATALDAIRAHDAELARGLERGVLAATDSRGLPLAAAAALAAGAIVRVVPARGQAGEPGERAGG